MTDGPILYLVDPAKPDGGSPVYERQIPKQIGLQEAWYRDSIAANPELAIKPCRDAGLTDEQWATWDIEVGTGAGPIDVLLVSESGRLCIVETKLASNPESRRKVVAQTLDYALALPEMTLENLPSLPAETDDWSCDPDDVRARLAQGDYLLVIVADENNAQAVRLAEAMLGQHLTSTWDLAFVDLVLFQNEGGDVLALPQLRRTLICDMRQVVVVRVEGESPEASIEVERLPAVETSSAGRQTWNRERFFRDLTAPPPTEKLIRGVAKLADDNSALSLSFGTGNRGCMSLKLAGSSLIELVADGRVRFRIRRIKLAFSRDSGEEYLRDLQEIFPGRLEDTTYPHLHPDEVAPAAERLLSLITRHAAAVTSLTQGADS